MVVSCRVVHGDVLDVLQTFPAGSFDAVITDPPYASGGLTIASKMRSTQAKYTSAKTKNQLPDFEGDQMDQRVWMRWTEEWLREAKRVCKKSAVLVCFIDHRQVAALQECVMRSDWLYRGLLVWDKTEASRPQLGRFSYQPEFMVWASKGDLSSKRNISPSVLKSVYRIALLQNNKVHQTQKPVELMRELCRVVEFGGVVLDPFCGSGSTLVAAKQLGYSSVGIECSEEIVGVAQSRVDAVNAQTLLSTVEESC